MTVGAKAIEEVAQLGIPDTLTSLLSALHLLRQQD